MSLLKNLKNDSSIAGETDRLGGGFLRDSGAYLFTVSQAYIQPSDSGAIGIFVTFKDAADKTFEYAQYVTSGTAKGLKNTYEDKDGKEQYLPGYLMMNALAEMTTGFPLSELDSDDKLVEIYDKEAKAKKPKKVAVLTQMIGEKIYAGVLRQLVLKQVKNDAGTYVDDPAGGTREVNDIDKFFCAKEGKFEKLTTAEIRAGATEPKFFQAWSDKNTGVTQDRTKGKKGNGAAGAPGKPAAGAGEKPKSSLFG